MLNQEAIRFIENFYSKNYQKLYLHAKARLKHSAEAEVAVQEACLVACRKPEARMDGENPLRWMEKTISPGLKNFWSITGSACPRWMWSGRRFTHNPIRKVKERT